MSKDHWDAILASSPLNATAGKVTGKGPRGNELQQKLSPEYSWEAPPPLKSVKPYLIDPNFVDYTGKSNGRLTVIGLALDSHDPGGKKGSLWVCRCVCGRYVGRRGKSLRNERATGCNACSYTDHLRYHASGDMARKRAESPEARKWLTPEEQAAKDRAA